jgi:outer membrane protein TolC
MSAKNLKNLAGVALLLFSAGGTMAQTLTLKDAVQTAMKNYGTIRAKEQYAKASGATVQLSKKEYLPDLNLSFQQDYGTVNGQTGPLYGLRGLGTASAGPALSAQNYNAAFGALYLANVSWDFLSFGRAKEKIEVSKAAMKAIFTRNSSSTASAWRELISTCWLHNDCRAPGNATWNAPCRSVK